MMFAQAGAERLFDEAAILYQQADFQGSLDKFQQIEDSGLNSAALLYNIGNCYYKLNRIGKAILYYERALRIQPSDDDIKANLDIANQATTDKLHDPGQFALARRLIGILHFVPFTLVLRMAGALYLVMMVVLILRVFSRNPATRRGLSLGTALLAILLTLTAALGSLQWWDRLNRIEAIVQATEVRVKSSPGLEATEVFTIHEGARVRIDQQTSGWVEIVLPDGKAGWVPVEAVEKI